MADLLVADALEKVYGEGETATRALKSVSFTVAEGEFASIVGQSGSGKSTLLNLIGLLDTPTSGQVLFAGENTTALGRKGRARVRNEGLGFVFQFHYLLPEFTVWENLTMPAQIAGRTLSAEEQKRALETLTLLGLEGLERKNANQLSGGQKQRVAIGRALMNRPKLILADEPTGNLDTKNTATVYELFRTINAELGTTFLIVTHNPEVASACDRTIVMRDGVVVDDGDGTPAAV